MLTEFRKNLLDRFDELFVWSCRKGGDMMNNISSRIYCGLVKIAQDNDWDFITQEDPDNALNGVIKKTESLSAGAYSLVRTLAIASIIISLVLVGMVFALSHDKNRRAEHKDWLWWILGGGIIVFGVGGIIALLASIGGGL